MNGFKVSIPVAHVFDVDPRTGFMAPHPPIARLPEIWEPWEELLSAAIDVKVQIGDKVGLTEEEAETSRVWRNMVRQVRLAPYFFG